VRLHPRQCEVTNEALARRLTDLARALRHLPGEVIKPVNRNDECSFADDVDRRSEMGSSRHECGATEHADHFVGVCFAEEAQGDVPVLRGTKRTPRWSLRRRAASSTATSSGGHTATKSRAIPPVKRRPSIDPTAYGLGDSADAG
jgi:hypothetical protein